MNKKRELGVCPAGDLLLTHFFGDRLTSVKARRSQNEQVFQKMREIRALEEKVKTFIKRNPGSEVTVGVIESDSRHPDDIDYSVTVKNFDGTGEEPLKFLLIINPVWNNFKEYVINSSGILIEN